jgi:hypothetical protein
MQFGHSIRPDLVDECAQQRCAVRCHLQPHSWHLRRGVQRGVRRGVQRRACLIASRDFANTTSRCSVDVELYRWRITCHERTDGRCGDLHSDATAAERNRSTALPIGEPAIGSGGQAIASHLRRTLDGGDRLADELLTRLCPRGSAAVSACDSATVYVRAIARGRN